MTIVLRVHVSHDHSIPQLSHVFEIVRKIIYLKLDTMETDKKFKIVAFKYAEPTMKTNLFFVAISYI